MAIPGRIPGGPIRRLRAGPLAGVVSFKLAETGRPGQLPCRVGLHVRHDRFPQQYGSQAARRLVLGEALLPVSVMGVEALLSAATYRKLWFPNCFHRDFLEVFLYTDTCISLFALHLSQESVLMVFR